MQNISAIKKIIAQAVEQKIFPGCAVGIAHHNQQHYLNAGRLTYDSQSPPVNPDTYFDLASVTKTMLTSTLAFLLWEQKFFTWETVVNTPQSKLAKVGSPDQPILVKHLLQNTLVWDLPALSSFLNKPTKHRSQADRLQQTLLQAQLRFPPGTKYHYSNTSSILLGWFLEEVSGQNIVNLAKKHLWQPLGLEIFWGSENVYQLDIAPTEKTITNNLRPNFKTGETHDESAWLLQKISGPVGSAGLFGRIQDTTNFLSALLNPHQPLLSAASQQRIKTATIINHNQPVGWGWEFKPDWAGFSPSSINTVTGKTGFTGTSIFIDWDQQIGISILSNAIHPQRPPNRQTLNQFRQKIHQLILNN